LNGASSSPICDEGCCQAQINESNGSVLEFGVLATSGRVLNISSKGLLSAKLNAWDDLIFMMAGALTVLEEKARAA
jgi:hypothetical protein